MNVLACNAIDACGVARTSRICRILADDTVNAVIVLIAASDIDVFPRDAINAVS